MAEVNPYHHYEKDNIVISERKHCHNSLRLEPVAKYEIVREIPTEEGFPPLLLSYTYVLCKCDTCSEISLAETIEEIEDLYVIYPTEKRFITIDLPEIVQKSYQTAIRCEKARIPEATVVMVGRTLEALIKEFYPEQTTIFGGLKKLKDEEIISADIYNWANQLRVLRNIGAHAVVEKVEQIDAEESMDFLQAILEIVYDLRPKFMKMKERREKSK